MKKIKYLFLLIAICILLSGCGKMSKKQIAAAKKEMTEYIKNNMSENWNYEEGKISIDDELNTQIKLYNILDESNCFLESKNEYESLKKNLTDDSYLKKVSFYCEFNSEKVAHVTVDNIQELNLEKYEKNAQLYSNDDEIIKVNDDFYQQQKAQFISKCENLPYRDVFRNSDDYISRYAVYTGEVYQVYENDDAYDIIIAVTKDEWGYYGDVMGATIPKYAFNGRVLNGDVITIYGRLLGVTTYQTLFSGKATIPVIYVRYAELVN